MTPCAQDRAHRGWQHLPHCAPRPTPHLISTVRLGPLVAAAEISTTPCHRCSPPASDCDQSATRSLGCATPASRQSCVRRSGIGGTGRRPHPAQQDRDQDGVDGPPLGGRGAGGDAALQSQTGAPRLCDPAGASEVTRRTHPTTAVFVSALVRAWCDTPPRCAYGPPSRTRHTGGPRAQYLTDSSQRSRRSN